MSVSSDLVGLYPRRQKEEWRQEMTTEPLTDRRFCLKFARALYPGEPFELADLRVTPRPDGPDDAALARQVRLREQAEAMLEEKARQLRQVKKRFRLLRLLNWFLASFAMASGLLELRLCGWL